MLFPALRRKKKTQKRNQPLSYWIEGWFYLTIEFYNIYYGFLNLLAILNSLMVLFGSVKIIAQNCLQAPAE